MLNDFDITVMGDSIAKGLFLKDNKIMRIERNTVKLMQEHYGVSIENFSLFGQTLKKTVQKGFFDTYLENNAHKPNKVLVIALGGNDCDYNWKSICEGRCDYEHRHRVAPQDFKKNYENMIHLLQEKGVAVTAVIAPPIAIEVYLSYLL